MLLLEAWKRGTEMSKLQEHGSLILTSGRVFLKAEPDTSAIDIAGELEPFLVEFVKLNAQIYHG